MERVNKPTQLGPQSQEGVSFSICTPDRGSPHTLGNAVKLARATGVVGTKYGLIGYGSN
jgi:hypothetical protein